MLTRVLSVWLCVCLCVYQLFERTGAVANMPAALMTLLITTLLVYGIKVRQYELIINSLSAQCRTAC